MKQIWLLWLLLLALGGCTSSPTAVPTPANPSPSQATVAPLPTLYPTNTAVSQAALQPQATRPPSTVAPTATPFDFSQPVLKLQYAIPAIGLDRRLEGTASATIRLFDAPTGQQVDLANQSRTLLQLQNALETIELSDLPDDCDRCVAVSYDLPLSGLSGSGWLQDDILLASIENYFSVWLGRHFPPGTQIGLHRSASAYNVAHTVAVTAEGELWRWQATDAELPAPAVADDATLRQLISQVEAIPFNRLENEYSTDCPAYPRETIYIGGETPWQTRVTCPAYSLPISLVPLYDTLSGLAQPALDPERNLPLPDQIMPLTAVVYFQRPDGATLTLFNDGALLATDTAGITTTTQIPADEANQLALDLTNSGVLPRGVQNIIDPELDLEADSLLLARGELGMYEFAWSDNVGQALLPGVVRLDELLVELVGFIQPTPEASAPLTTTTPVTATTTVTATETITQP